MNKDLFMPVLEAAFTENRLSHLLDAHIRERLFLFADFLQQESNKYNLTAIKDFEGIIYKHFVDSLLVAEHIPNGASMIDIGCGAGFPSLPLAICRPDLKITALDSVSKKICFIEKCISILGLTNVNCVCDRAEIAAHTHLRNSFDVAISRALAPFPILAELCIPFVRPSGTLLAMKGPEGTSELEGLRLLPKLGAGEPEILTYNLLIGAQQIGRTLIITGKLGKTPNNFPRNFSQISKKPLS
jgi:16S rRNA (guanine527-N7)-methyltransferase